MLLKVCERQYGLGGIGCTSAGLQDDVMNWLGALHSGV